MESPETGRGESKRKSGKIAAALLKSWFYLLIIVHPICVEVKKDCAQPEWLS
jgi:hypothetical protein